MATKPVRYLKIPGNSELISRWIIFATGPFNKEDIILTKRTKQVDKMTKDVINKMVPVSHSGQ